MDWPRVITQVILLGWVFFVIVLFIRYLYNTYNCAEYFDDIEDDQ